MILFSTFKLFTMIKEQIRTITDAWSSQGMLCHRPKDVQAKVTMLKPRFTMVTYNSDFFHDRKWKRNH